MRCGRCAAAKGALSGEVSGVWLDGAQIFNGVGLWTQSTPRALFTTRNADPTGLSQINGVVLLDFFAYIKSFLRTVDDSDLTMGSGTFGGIGSGNGVTPPAMPRTTLCIPDGPAACSVYELALDGSGNTTGAPAMDEQGDSTRQTTWRPFLTEPATLLHVVNGSRDSAATLAPGYGEEGGSVGPLAINVPDAVDEAHWYVKPVASLPGHTPATSGGAGLPHAPLYVCSGFNRKHGTGEDRTTAPPDAYPLPVASAPGGGDPGSSDGESKASTGPCACSLGNPSVASVASTTDEGTGATKSPAGHWTDPVPAVIYGGGQVLPPVAPQPIFFEKGWAPDTVWGKLTDCNRAKLQALFDSGWKFATNSDGTASINKLKGNNSNIDLEVRNDDSGEGWLDWWLEGGDGQWVEDEWGVSFDSKTIYLDKNDNDRAAELLNRLLGSIDGCGKDAAQNITKTNFLDTNVIKQFIGLASLAGEDVDRIEALINTTDSTEARRVTQAGQIGYTGVLDALVAQAEANMAMAVGIGGIKPALAGLAKLKQFDRLVKLSRLVKLARQIKGGLKTLGAAGKQKGVRVVSSPDDVKTVFNLLTKGAKKVEDLGG